VRLTEILKEIVSADGGEIFIGERQISGLIIDKDGSRLTISTEETLINNERVNISGKQYALPGETISYSCLSNLVFSEFLWEIDGPNASFVDEINNTEAVSVAFDSVGEYFLTMSATLPDGTVKRQEVEIVCALGLISSKIVGPSEIREQSPTRYVLLSDVDCDSVSWDISGGGEIIRVGDSNDVYIQPDDSGESIVLTSTARKDKYSDSSESIYVKIELCDILPPDVERAQIKTVNYSRDSDEITVDIYPFHGRFFASDIEYQICEKGNDFINIDVSDIVPYMEEFTISSQQIPDGYYDIRVRNIDSEGNVGAWSTGLSFKVDRIEVYVNDLYSKLTHYYRFDTLSPLDQVGGANCTTYSSSLESWGDEGQLVVSMRDSGGYGRISIPSIDTNYTISMRIRFQDYNATRMKIYAWYASGESISTNYNEFYSYYVSSTQRSLKLFFERGSGTNYEYTPGVNFPVEEWFTFTVKFELSLLKFYIDGILVKKISATYPDSTVPYLYIGKDGHMDIEEFCIWKDEFLSDEDILRWHKGKISERTLSP
jgi:hypothetical protein